MKSSTLMANKTLKHSRTARGKQPTWVQAALPFEVLAASKAQQQFVHCCSWQDTTNTETFLLSYLEKNVGCLFQQSNNHSKATQTV